MVSYLASLGVIVKNKKLYETAFTHKSYGNEQSIDNNERLEFLGDAVLELLVTEFLFKEFPNAPEGKMTALRSSAVREDSLAELAKRINLGKSIKLSKGEKHGYKKNYILANTVEALLGAIYLDRGMRASKRFLQEYLFPEIKKVEELNDYIGPKSRFQEWAQAEKNITPHYSLISSTGPDHSKTFEMAVFLEKDTVGIGKGNSKQLAESNAAENALLHFEVSKISII